jgi:hypothetical protein
MSSPLKIEWSQCAENTITPQVWGLWTSYKVGDGIRWPKPECVSSKDYEVKRRDVVEGQAGDNIWIFAEEV